MSARNRRLHNAAPGTLQYLLQEPIRQATYRPCCQSVDVHRFDCEDVAREHRGAGPFGPMRGAS